MAAKPYTAACSLQQGWGENKKGKSVWESVGWDKDHLLGKAQAACVSKAKQEIHPLILPGDVQLFPG